MVRNDYNAHKTVKPSRAMMKVHKKADDNTIIGIHNHSNNSQPSIDDICTFVARKYKYGIVTCHNGTVYKYTINGKNSVNVDIYLVRINEIFYSGDTDELEKTINILSENGVDLEVF